MFQRHTCLFIFRIFIVSFQECFQFNFIILFKVSYYFTVFCFHCFCLILFFNYVSSFYVRVFQCFILFFFVNLFADMFYLQMVQQTELYLAFLIVSTSIKKHWPITSAITFVCIRGLTIYTVSDTLLVPSPLDSAPGPLFLRRCGVTRSEVLGSKAKGRMLFKEKCFVLKVI